MAARTSGKRDREGQKEEEIVEGKMRKHDNAQDVKVWLFIISRNKCG